MDGLTSTGEPVDAVEWLDTLTEDTRRARATDLRNWVAWRAEHGLTVDGATRDDVDLWAGHLHRRGFAYGTVSRRVGSVRGYYAATGRWATRDPRPYPERRDVAPVSDDVLARLLVTAGDRDRVIVAALARGVTIRALRAARVGDAGTLTGDALPGDVLDRLTAGRPPGAPLLVTPGGVTLSTSAIRKAVARVGEVAGHPEVTVPALRARARSDR